MNSLGEEFRQSTTDSPVFGASAGRSKGSILEPSTGSFTHLPGNWWRLLARGLSSCAYEPVWASSGSKGKPLKSPAEPTPSLITQLQKSLSITSITLYWLRQSKSPTQFQGKGKETSSLGGGLARFCKSICPSVKNVSVWGNAWAKILRWEKAEPIWGHKKSLVRLACSQEKEIVTRGSSRGHQPKSSSLLLRSRSF